jgi:hypothetical protein
VTDPDTVLDRMRIREVADLYFFYCDAHEPENVVKCFSRDGVFRSATQAEMKLQGHAELEEGFRSFTAYGRACHSVASMEIIVDGQTATSRLFGTCHLAGAAEVGGPIFVRGLHYVDRWIVEDGRWVIAERVHEGLWQFENTLIEKMLPPKSCAPVEPRR